MHRFFVNSSQIKENHVTITGEDFKHITKVLRLRDGEMIEVCDGMGTDYLVKLDGFESKDAVRSGTIIDCFKSRGENETMSIHLFQGLPKGTKMESIIQKNVELGVDEIIPFYSKRSVIREKKDKKSERWQRIAYEAAKQSKRGKIPVVSQILPFEEILNQSKNFDLLILAYENELNQSLKKSLTEFEKRKTLLKIGVIIGPEGGFDEDEVKQLKGAQVVSLGNRILRTETAGMVLVSQLNFWRED